MTMFPADYKPDVEDAFARYNNQRCARVEMLVASAACSILTRDATNAVEQLRAASALAEAIALSLDPEDEAS